VRSRRRLTGRQDSPHHLWSSSPTERGNQPGGTPSGVLLRPCRDRSSSRSGNVKEMARPPTEVPAAFVLLEFYSGLRCPSRRSPTCAPRSRPGQAHDLPRANVDSPRCRSQFSLALSGAGVGASRATFPKRTLLRKLTARPPRTPSIRRPAVPVGGLARRARLGGRDLIEPTLMKQLSGNLRSTQLARHTRASTTLYRAGPLRRPVRPAPSAAARCPRCSKRQRSGHPHFPVIVLSLFVGDCCPTWRQIRPPLQGLATTAVGDAWSTAARP